METDPALLAEYNANQGAHQRMLEEGEFTITEMLKNAGIPFHVIEKRRKTLDSIKKKAARNELSAPLQEVTDVLGFRIICLFLPDIDRIVAQLRKSFLIISVDDKRSSKEADVFGYLSFHVLARLPRSCKGPRYDGLKDLIFEIQVRTVSMHAWSIISHHLDYKTPNAVPSELKRDFNALSALFYVADQHFEMFFRSSKVSRRKAVAEVGAILHAKPAEINLDTLTAYLTRRYPDRGHGDATGTSLLVEELKKGGITTIDVLERELERGKRAFLAREKKYPPWIQGGGPRRFVDVGVVRSTLAIFNPAFRALAGGSNAEVAKTYDEFLPLVSPSKK
jgi:ppGpp synthetase/RelA/SpoT-type nucleotidyltranferase